jgi:L-seryl-tRNA(Ser) seleniumtransferase
LSVEDGVSRLGGGSLPASQLPSVLLCIRSANQSADSVASVLRSACVPIIPRIEDNAVLLDMRTVFPQEVPDVISACSSGDVQQ